MYNFKKRNLVPVILVAGLFVFFIFLARPYIFKHYQLIGIIRINIFSKVNRFASFISKMDRIRDLTEENLALEDKNRKLLSELAVYVDLDSQNSFLRESLGLNLPIEYSLIEARTFDMQFSPEGHFMLINKGRTDNIKEGDIVISSSGVLIGRVNSIYESFSRVALITNSDLKITIKLLNKDIIAISRGMLDNGIRLDFVSQNDEISEGDVGVTNGNDEFPPGLLVGFVSKVGPNDGNLFREVLMKPEFKQMKLDRVLILDK